MCLNKMISYIILCLYIFICICFVSNKVLLKVDCGLVSSELYMSICCNALMKLVIDKLSLTSILLYLGIRSLYWTSLTEVKIAL